MSATMQGIVTDEPVGALNDILMAKGMAEDLHAAYPGHLWAVSCNGKTGMADVRNMALSGNYGFRIKLHQTYSASEFKAKVLRAGGEILERYRLTRGKANDGEYGDLRQDYAGQIKGDKS